MAIGIDIVIKHIGCRRFTYRGYGQIIIGLRIIIRRWIRVCNYIEGYRSRIDCTI